VPALQNRDAVPASNKHRQISRPDSKKEEGRNGVSAKAKPKALKEKELLKIHPRESKDQDIPRQEKQLTSPLALRENFDQGNLRP